MQIPLAVIADYANATSDGKLNIMGIFDRIRANEYPAVHLNACLVLRFTASASERGQTKTLKIMLLDQDGLDLGGIESTIEIPRDAPLNVSFNQIIELRMLQFPHPGDYVFHILINGDPKATVQFLLENPAQTASTDQ